MWLTMPSALSALARALGEGEYPATGGTEDFLARYPPQSLGLLCLLPQVPTRWPKGSVQGALIPLPIVGMPFEQIGIDLIEPL